MNITTEPVTKRSTENLNWIESVTVTEEHLLTFLDNRLMGKKAFESN